ncbi:NACHT domain-containing protein [Streptomyces sp. NPDC049881]|uniref:NACHT domain-containing protein n=1 Tax=Streptomyces sp. NPDC049881 TaxID=3155778 RepID=UPI00344794C2
MVDSLVLARTLVAPAVRHLLASRRREAERSLGLAELVNVSVRDDFKRRRLHREIDAIIDAVALRLDPLCRHELPGLDDGERQAVLDAVADTFLAADLSDDAFFRADAEPVKLARHLRSALPRVPDRRAFGEPAAVLYERLLDECCAVYTRLVVHLAPFAPRAVAELLSRTSSLAEQVETVLSRLPVRTLQAPQGTDLDQQFLERYLQLLSSTLDEVDLFGIDVHSFRPRVPLSVAYISLTVSSEDEGARRGPSQAWRAGDLLGDDSPAEATLGVEAALGAVRRVMIRGEAGSGKTTLLRWLAVNAARGSFTGHLAPWNGSVPFLVRLRSYVGARLPAPERLVEGAADPIVGLMPEGWVHRQLSSGDALLLVDGVDELPARERRAAREWVIGLLHAYPGIRVVITSRPAAAAARWLAPEGFASTFLEPMGPGQVGQLVEHWYAAIRDAGQLPCHPDELPDYQRALSRHLEVSPHLRGLATSPLLCAMLYALNLDRRTALPLDRMSV